MYTILQAIFGSTWAMTEDYLNIIVSITQRHGNDLNAAAAAYEARMGKIKEAEGVLLSGTKSIYMAGDGVAIQNVHGPLFPKANLMSDISGASSVAVLEADYLKAMSDPNVKSLIMDFDTPGGNIIGIEQFANKIYANRETKPQVAFCSSICASAGAWLASALPERIINPTAVCGSIGVMQTRIDDKKAQEKEGIIEIDILSSNAPDKVLDPTSKENQEKIRENLNVVEKVFISTLARNHGISEQQVIDKFGKGGVLVGQRAIDAGLADRVGFLDNVLQEMREKGKTSGAPKSRGKRMDNEKTEDTSSLATPEQVKAQVDSAVASAVANVNIEAKVTDLITAAKANPKSIKSSGYFVKSVQSKITSEESRTALLNLHVACAAVGAGMEEDLEAFVEGLTTPNLTGDVFSDEENTQAAPKTAVEPKNPSEDEEVEAIMNRRREQAEARSKEGALKI